jgi:hypothetical protein
LRFVCEGSFILSFFCFFFVFRFLHYLEAKNLSPRNLKVLCSLIFFLCIFCPFVHIYIYIYIFYIFLYFLYFDIYFLKNITSTLTR